METFNFVLCSPRTDTYPAGDTFRMGKGHEFSVKPLLPIQRTFVLEFEEGLKWCANDSGVFVNTLTPTMNMLALTEFYERHQMWKRFVYAHPIYGNLTVRFAEPFAPPKARRGGSGWTEGFELKIIEQA